MGSSKKRRCSELPSPDSIPRAVERGKSPPKPETHSKHRPPSFWTTLSKVRVSRGGLREFDRRKSPIEQKSSHPFFPSVNQSFIGSHFDLSRFARHGGPDLAHLRGFANMPKKSSASHKRPGVVRSSPYDADFEQKLIDTGIFPHNDVSKPQNLEDIRKYTRKPRPSLSPSHFDERKFEEYSALRKRPVGEANTMADIIPIVAGEGRKNHHYVTDSCFTNTASILDNVTKPKPDMYDGAWPEQLDPRIRRSLGPHIVPSKNSSRPMVPNFFLEAKSAEGRADVAMRQACYHGAIGARAMSSIQNYGETESRHDGNAYSFSSTYHNGTGTLQLYATHMTQPTAPGERSQYHMTEIDSFAMTGNSGRFREAASSFRNLRDLGKSYRDSFINQANDAIRRAPEPSLPSTFTGSHEPRLSGYEDLSDTSTDELAAEESHSKRPRRTVPPQPRSRKST